MRKIKRKDLHDELYRHCASKNMDIAYLTEAVVKGSKGDKQALSEIYNLTSRMVYFTALKITQNENDAQDLVQESYIKAFQSLDTLRDGTAFIKWLKTITANLCKNHLKKSRPVLFESEEQQEYELGVVTETNEDFLPEQYVDSKEKSRLVMDIVDSLPELQRTTIILYYFNELSVTEIAAIMDTSEGTVKSRLNYARSKIKSEVERLESKDTRLYSMAALPVLSKILQGVSQDYNMPAESSTAVLSAVLKAGVKPAEAAPSTGSAEGTLFHSVVSAKQGAFSLSAVIAKLSVTSMISKIVIGLAALGLITGGIAIGRVGGKSPSGQKEYRPLPQDIVMEQLLGKSQNEIAAELGKPDEVNEDGTFLYHFDNLKQSVTVNFIQNKASLVSCRNPEISLKGIKIGKRLEDVRDTFAKLPDASLEEENKDCGSLLGIFYSMGKYTYQYLYDKNEKIRYISVSMPITISDSSQNTSENISEDISENTGSTTESMNSESSTGKSSDENDFTGIYRNYFLKNFTLKNPQAFFTDLTHDGQDEMIVIYGDGMSGELAVITIDKNKQAKQIYTAYCATSTNQQYCYRLYTENSKAYLMVNASFQRQGNPQEFYRIFSLDETGGEILYKERNIEYVINQNGDIEGTTQTELDHLNQELEDYKSKSEMLLDSSTGDMVYPNGESFISGLDNKNHFAEKSRMEKDG